MDLARLRRSKGFSQRSLAEAAGVAPSTIYVIENHRHSPNPMTLRKLAYALDVTTEQVWEAIEAPKGAASLLSPEEEERRREELEEREEELTARVEELTQGLSLADLRDEARIDEAMSEMERLRVLRRQLDNVRRELAGSSRQ